jgi:outer membrane phospholipase A
MRVLAVTAALAACSLSGCARSPRLEAWLASTPATSQATAPGTDDATAQAPAISAADEPPARRRRHFPRLLTHRPIYVLVGPETPDLKFQFSFRIPLLAQGGPEDEDPVLSNLYFGYSQLSFWDISEPSTATIDTTYQPELFFATKTPPFEASRFGATGLGFQIGAQHESNGRPGPESRNANYVYFTPSVYFGNPRGIHGEFSPAGKVYFEQKSDTPDLEKFLGHVELFAAVRFGEDLHITATGRIADDPGKGSFQLDVSYPLRKLRADAYFHVQYFNGYAESLLNYREHDQVVRIGLSFVR